MLATWGANQGFSPSSLFSAGEQGTWYDPSDLTTLFQDAAGTTPVTAVEQPVGRMLDKSGRGNHATQTTSANRPTLSARYNLLTKTEQFDNAAWTKTAATITSNTIVAPDGSLTGSKLISTGSNGSLSYLSVTPGNNVASIIDLRTGTVTTTVTGTWSSLTATNQGNGWWRIVGVTQQSYVFSIHAKEGEWRYLQIQSTNGVYVYPAQTSSSVGTGDGYSGIYIWGADLRVANDGVGIPAYQRVNTATDYDTVGFPMYLKFNGTSSAMATNSITPGTDKAQVFAGVRKFSDAAAGLIAGISADINTNNGSFEMAASYLNTTRDTYAYANKGATISLAFANGYVAPTTNVISGLGNISGDSSILRVNSTQVAINTNDQGTGNYLAYPLYIGARGGTSLWFNGRIYSMIVRFGSNLTTSQITNTEKYVNNLTKAY